jgi:PAS domain S-box-containing protein
VLVVEDSPHDLAALRRALAPSRTEIEACGDAEEALALAGELAGFDVMVVDHGLPGRSGLELCRQLLELADCPPIVVLTGSGSELLAADYLRLGVSDYLVKDLGQHYLRLMPLVLSVNVRRHRDRVERLRYQRRLAEESGRRKALLDSLPVGVYSVDRDFLLVELNRAAEELTGRTAAEALGQPCDEIFRSSECGPACPLRQAMERGEPLGPLDLELLTPRGEAVPLSYTASGVFRQEGGALGGVAVFQDVTMLKALEQGRASMLSLLAHDMKTPLVSIKGFTKLLRENRRELAEDKRTTYLEVVHKEAEQLHRLVVDFLESARQGVHGLRLNLAAGDLRPLVGEVAAHCASQAEQQGLELVQELPEAAAPAEVDRGRLVRAVRNLVDNALSHSPAGGKVVLRLVPGRYEHALEVSDQGPGVDPRELPELFKPFFRSHSSQARAGYGLGLAGVKAIVEAHHGKVEAENRPQGGCTFRILLPAAPS